MEKTCPVCGERLREGALLEFTHASRQFAFCSLDCMRLFQQFPEVYEGDETAQIEAIEDSGF